MPPTPAGLIVILDGTSAPNMAALLEFMYRGEVHVSQESLSSFLKAAECLQVRIPASLLAACCSKPPITRARINGA